jgi:tripartite-type tricarboxylate transporter receptor subunit TctC
MRPLAAIVALAATMLSLLGSGAAAQESYPSRQVRLIVPTNAGGAPDTLARILAQKLATHYSQPFVVENRSGAANLIGSDFVAKSPPDGYTLLLGTTQVFGILPGMNPKMPFDAVKDFAPIMRFADAPHLIVAPVSSAPNTIQEFVKHVAERPGKLSYGSSGIGSSHHLIMEALLDRAGGLKMIHVPFKGSQDNLQALLGGNLDFAVIAVSSSIRQIKAGKIKALGLASSNRSKLSPDIVPIAEQGFPGFNLSNWMGLFAPAGTPKPVLSSLEATLMKFFKEPEMSATLEKIGFELAVQGSEEYAKQIRVDLDTYAKVIRAANVKME